MTALDFAPAPGAAPAPARVLRHARTELGLLLRNGEQLLLALVIPLGVIVLGRLLGGPWGDLVVLTPSVLALAVWSSTFTSLAIATAFERRYGVLERLAATPLGRSGLLVGKTVSTLAVAATQLVAVALLAVALGWRPAWSAASLALGVLAITLAGVAFAGFALALAGRLRAEATLGLANVIYVLFAAGGGLALPLTRYPDAMAAIVRLLPTGALGEGLRSYAVGGTSGWPLLILAAWAGLGVLAAWKGFRWIS